MRRKQSRSTKLYLGWLRLDHSKEEIVIHFFYFNEHFRPGTPENSNGIFVVANVVIFLVYASQTPPGTPISKLVGCLVPGFSNYWGGGGGGGGIAPKISNIGGKDFENPNIPSA